MARRRRRKAHSPAARARRVAKRRARRSHRKAHRKGRMPAGLAAYWAGKRGAKAKRHRPSRKARLHRKRAKSRRRARKTAVAIAVAPNPVRRSRRHRRRAMHHKRRHRRSRVGINPGALTLGGGLSGFVANLKSTFLSGGVKGFAAAAAGAGGAVFAGTMVARVTTPVIAKFAPSLLSNPVIPRLLGAAHYYVTGWALAKYTPGISPRTRRAMLTGATAAAVLEAIKPGVVRDTAARLPVVGGLFGNTLSGLADGMGDYVQFALSGNGADGAGHVGEGVSDYVALGDSDANDGGAADAVGMGEYIAFR